MYESDKMYHQLIPSEFKHSWFETFSTYSQQLQNAIESVKNVAFGIVQNSDSSVGSNDHQYRPFAKFEIPNFAKPISETKRTRCFRSGKSH